MEAPRSRRRAPGYWKGRKVRLALTDGEWELLDAESRRLSWTLALLLSNCVSRYANELRRAGRTNDNWRNEASRADLTGVQQ